MIPVFIGFDARESVAFDVLAHSIQARASRPVSITPIALHQLGGIFSRPRDPLQSTDFSFSRFLTPYLRDFSGWALFMDCDMLCLDDIAKLWALRDDRFAVQVVKHDHRPRERQKFLGEPQTAYAKKNWSSVMLFNCRQCLRLSAEYVNEASGLDLHQFRWLMHDGQIGEIPPEWNHLVGYDEPKPASLVHYTLGGPYFAEYRDCEYAQEWFSEFRRMINGIGNGQ